jgi:hypothetical protein
MPCSLVDFYRRFGGIYRNVEMHPEDGGDTFLRNDDNLRDYKVSQPRIPQWTIYDFAV